MSAHGHVWGSYDDRDLYDDRRVTPHVVAGDGVSPYALDVESLAVMRSAPRCDGLRDAVANP